jgi:hypothetical protein
MDVNVAPDFDKCEGGINRIHAPVPVELGL